MPVNRHDIWIAFDVTNGNPNGDPDAGNMPRIEPNSGKGLVSDVCLKRKVRNFVAGFPPAASDKGNQFEIFITQGAVLERSIRAGVESTAKEVGAKATKQQKSEAAANWLCRRYFDIRAFGGVLSVGDEVMKGSAYGQVRGPIQFTLGMSADPIPMQELTLTRCAVTEEKKADSERTMGHKHIVPYGLYIAKAYVSPLFAERTGFDEADLKLFFDALRHLFTNDQSAARAEMTVQAAYAFEHVGTQGPKNAEQNKREQQLGCAHAHKLFETINIKKKTTVTTFPTGINDYEPLTPTGWDDNGNNPKFPGVVLHRIV